MSHKRPRVQTARAPTQRLAGTNPKTGPSDRYTLSQPNTPASRSQQPQLRLSSSRTTWTENFVGLRLGVRRWLHWIRVCFLVVALGSGILHYLPIPFYFSTIFSIPLFMVPPSAWKFGGRTTDREADRARSRLCRKKAREADRGHPRLCRKTAREADSGHSSFSDSHSLSMRSIELA